MAHGFRWSVAVVLLLSLWCEVVVDQSTYFVRSYFRAQAMTSVLNSVELVEAKYASADTANSDAANPESAPKHETQKKHGGAAALDFSSAHSAVSIRTETFDVFFTCTQLRFYSSGTYIEPDQGLPLRPPIS